MKNAILTKIKTNKHVVAASVAVSTLTVGTQAFAAVGDPVDIGATVTASVQTAVTSTITMFMALLPIALTVFAATWGVRRAMKFFKGASV